MVLEHDVFLSFNLNFKSEVEKLDEKLTDLGYKVARNSQSPSNHATLSSQIAELIKNSKVIVCFITREYFKSNLCSSEINYANEIEKLLITLMIDDIKTEDIADIITNKDQNLKTNITKLNNRYNYYKI